MPKAYFARIFEYPPLNISGSHIRLIRLLPKSKDGTLRLQLQNNVPIGSDKFDSFALSYEWRPSRPRRTILIEDQISLIGKNLFLFLESIYHQHAGGNDIDWLWVDAICIDQESISERNHQAQRMKEVYSQARMVITWLGPSHNSRDRDVFNILNQLGSNNEDCVERFGILGFDAIRNKNCFETLFSLYARSYWKRLWIVQEIALASKVLVLCGENSTDLSNILKSLHLWYHGTFISSEYHRVLRSFNKLRLFLDEYQSSAVMPLLLLIQYFGGASCTMMHDKVYGLLGLADNAEDLHVNYDVSLDELFLTVLSIAPVETTLENFYGFADALHIFFEITAAESVLLPNDSRNSVTRSRIPFLSLNSTTNSKSSNGIITQQTLLNKFFSWHGASFHASTEWFKTVIKTYRLAYWKKENECSPCRCPICLQNESSMLQSEHPDELLKEPLEKHYTVYRWFEERDGSLSNQTDVPFFFLLYKRGCYMATFFYHKSNAPANFMFRDPYESSWRIDTFEVPRQLKNSSGFFKVEINIALPLISALILLAHVFPRNFDERQVRRRRT